MSPLRTSIARAPLLSLGALLFAIGLFLALDPFLPAGRAEARLVELLPVSGTMGGERLAVWEYEVGARVVRVLDARSADPAVLTAGTTRPVRYDPLDPERSLIERGDEGKGVIFLLGLALGLILAGLREFAAPPRPTPADR